LSEADFVITRVSPDRSESVYNIEVDGPSHSLPTSQRLSRRRDQHLQEACGVRIARIPLLKSSTGEWLQEGEYEAAVREVLQGLQLLLPPARMTPLHRVESARRRCERCCTGGSCNHCSCPSEQRPSREALRLASKSVDSLSSRGGGARGAAAVAVAVTELCE
jgi:hypothetical protein